MIYTYGLEHKILEIDCSGSVTENKTLSKCVLNKCKLSVPVKFVMSKKITTLSNYHNYRMVFMYDFPQQKLAHP